MNHVAVVIEGGAVQEIHAPSDVLIKVYDHDVLEGGGVLETHWLDGEIVFSEVIERKEETDGNSQW